MEVVTLEKHEGFRSKKNPRTLEEFCERLDLTVVEDNPEGEEDAGLLVLERVGSRQMRVSLTYGGSSQVTKVNVWVNKNLVVSGDYPMELSESYPIIYQDIIGRVTRGMTREQAYLKIYQLTRKGGEARLRGACKRKAKARANNGYLEQKSYYCRIMASDSYLAAGNQLKELRLERDLTLMKLSEATGITCATLVKWEKGRVRPSVDKMGTLAVYYDIPYLEIKGWYDECEG